MMIMMMKKITIIMKTWTIILFITSGIMQDKNIEKIGVSLNVKTIEGVNNNFINETLNKHRGLLKNLNRTFEALREDEKRLRKQNYGDDIDLDAFIDAYIDLKQGKEVDEKLFIKAK